MNRSDYIKQYSVEIKSSFGKSGSGILIKVDDSHCYLATAKHNFINSEKREESWGDIDEVTLKNDLDKIEVMKQDTKVCRVVDIKHSCEDLIIFSIDNHQEHTQNLDKIHILYEDNYSDEFEYFFHGYPIEKNRDDGFINELRSRNNSEKNCYLYDISSNISLRYTSLQGFSGSGVFLNDGAKYYLVGIVLQRIDGLSSFTAFSLPKFLKENDSSIPIKQDMINLKNLGDMYSRIIERNPNNFLIQEHKKVLPNSYKYNKILDDTVNLEKIAIKLEFSNRLYDLEADYRKELADMYLLGTVLSKHCGDETTSKKYFKKAREYEPTYIGYLKDLDIIYSKEKLMREAKIAFVDGNYTESKLIFKRCLHLYIEDNDRIYIYKKLVDIGKIQNNKKEMIHGYEKLLDLYEEDEKLIRAEIFYNLSELTDNKSYQIDVLKKGLSLIAYESLDSFIEIKYKMKKSKNKLLKNDDIYFGLKLLLKRLSELDYQYEDEYRELILRDRYKFDLRVLIKKISHQLQWVWGFILLVIVVVYSIYFFEYEPWYKVLQEIIFQSKDIFK